MELSDRERELLRYAIECMNTRDAVIDYAGTPEEEGQRKDHEEATNLYVKLGGNRHIVDY